MYSIIYIYIYVWHYSLYAIFCILNLIFYILHVYNHYRLIGWWFLFVLPFCLVKILLWLDQEMHKMCPDISVWVLRTNSLRNCGAHRHRYLQIFIIWAYYRDSQLVTPNCGDFVGIPPKMPLMQIYELLWFAQHHQHHQLLHPAKKAHQSDVFETRTS